MPEADRKAVQDALGWLDFYNGAVDGAFGKRTRDSIVAYQQSVGAAPDGIVSPAELEALKTAAQRARAAVDFALVDDRISGVRIGAPLKLSDQTQTFERRHDLAERRRQRLPGAAGVAPAKRATTSASPRSTRS